MPEEITLRLSQEDAETLRVCVSNFYAFYDTESIGRLLTRIVDALSAADAPGRATAGEGYYVGVDALGQKALVPNNVHFEPYDGEDA